MSESSPSRRLILASTSPRRRDLLARLGVTFEIFDPDTHEPPPAPEIDGDVYATAMARHKARVAWKKIVADPRFAASNTSGVLVDVLAADTVVQVGREILGKPVDQADARRILRRLSGTAHSVFTGYCLLTGIADGRAEFDEFSGADEAKIVFRDLTPEEIESYVDSGESFGKAGAYAVQERGDRFVARIDGAFTTVVGLPLSIVADCLSARGYDVDRAVLRSDRFGEFHS